jgi:hypothetical protein
MVDNLALAWLECNAFDAQLWPEVEVMGRDYREITFVSSNNLRSFIGEIA